MSFYYNNVVAHEAVAEESGPMEAMSYSLYDSFAARRFEGNVAGVVVSGSEPPPTVMQAIAAELGAPTTGFASTGSSGPVRIRFFTERREIAACGYVSVAVATELVQRGIWHANEGPAGEERATTPAGVLPIRLKPDPSGVRVEISYRPRPVQGKDVDRMSVESLLGVPSDPGLPIEIVDTGLRHLVVAFESPNILAQLAIDVTALRVFSGSYGVDTICAFAWLSDGRFRMRDLTAAIGDLEESASGTTSAALAMYAARHALLGGQRTLTIEQGVEMNRPSRIEVALAGHEDTWQAHVSGTAIKSAAGRVFLDRGAT
jgi:trans-2,3-dihydro-3-hydroxyanthranilate isomerase